MFKKIKDFLPIIAVGIAVGVSKVIEGINEQRAEERINNMEERIALLEQREEETDEEES